MFLSALGYFRAGSADGGTAFQRSRHPKSTGGVGSGYCEIDFKGFCQIGDNRYCGSLTDSLVCFTKVAGKLSLPDAYQLVGIRVTGIAAADWLPSAQ
jgi:hypothetical protein